MANLIALKRQLICTFTRQHLFKALMQAKDITFIAAKMLEQRRTARIKEVLRNICQQRIMRKFRRRLERQGNGYDRRLKNYIRK
jgi:hypothetical protein